MKWKTFKHRLRHHEQFLKENPDLPDKTRKVYEEIITDLKAKGWDSKYA